VLDVNLAPAGAVIPPGTTIVEVDRAPARGFGDRVHVVMADRRSAEAGRAIAAGVGWYQWGDGRGVFVTHDAEGGSIVEAEAMLLDRIYTSLHEVCGVRRVVFDGLEAGCRLASTQIGEEPAAVVVVAAYADEC
jgi:pyruvoyl-dependent arginine decarboxylase (PvlArgDC)